MARIEREFGKSSVYVQLAKNTEEGVPAFHVANHIPDCQFLKHPRHMLCTGRLSGEEVETVWVEIGNGGSISRDTNPGHRHEILEDIAGDWNFKKFVSMRE